MRFSIVAGALLGVFCVAEQSPVGTNATEVQELFAELTELPTCATACVSEALKSTQCEPTDLACLCTDEPYITQSGLCIASNCTISQALTAQGWQKKACHAPVRDTGPTTRRCGIAFLTLGAIVVIGRFAARYFIQGSSIGLDDWAVLAAYILLIPSTIIVWLMISNGGLGRDIWTVPHDQITNLLRYFYIEEYIYQTCIYLAKVSITLLYMRIFPREVGVRFNQACWVTLGAITIWWLAFIIYFPLQCRPISYVWTQWDGEHTGYCTNFQTATYVNSSFNIFFDFVLLGLPIPKLAALQVRDTRRKVGVMLTFMVGFFVTICSIVRLKYLAQVGQLTNVTYHYNDVTLWSGLEGDLAVVCACLPTLIGPTAQFFKRTIGGKITSYRMSSKDKSKEISGYSTVDKSVHRLPSNASDRGLEHVDEQKRSQKSGGIEKTVVTSMYNMPEGHSSDGDDIELIIQSPRGTKKTAPWDA